MTKSYFNWSGGKDSSLALYHAMKDPKLNIEALLTTVNKTYQRISMHGVQEALLFEQQKQIGLPLHTLYLNDQPTMAEYEAKMAAMLKSLVGDGFNNSVFGDIFLEDLKEYRVQKLKEVGITASFPIWKRDTKELIHEFLDLGFKTILVCVKSELLDKSFAGRVIDRDFLKDLPSNVDPCGENGEFHTYVFEGPIFKNPIPIKVGETILRTYEAPKVKDDTCNGTAPSSMGFWFTDIMLDKNLNE